jgi:hypothetical protein
MKWLDWLVGRVMDAWVRSRVRRGLSVYTW